MPGSYESINYALRPAKTIERKMLCDAFRKLSAFQSINKYQYIGFGSTYFSDFSLFHKHLGINDMVSIEKDKHNEDRFNFNKPYSCITMKFKSSSDILPHLKWTKESIIWLDYDEHLDSDKLMDINTSCANVKSGSILLVTVNAHADVKEDTTGDGLKEARYKMLSDRVSEGKIPIGVDGRDLNRKGLSNVYYQIIINEINECLSIRNGGLSNEKQLEFKQLFNFTYEDGAKMLTVGGIFVSKEDLPKFEKANFGELDFIKDSSAHFNLEVPCLTFKELRFLDSLLPSKISNDGIIDKELKIITKIPQRDVKKYIKVYRYFPTFTEAIV